MVWLDIGVGFGELESDNDDSAEEDEEGIAACEVGPGRVAARTCANQSWKASVTSRSASSITLMR